MKYDVVIQQSDAAPLAVVRKRGRNHHPHPPTIRLTLTDINSARHPESAVQAENSPLPS
jgi:hypothetical protein